MELTSTLLSVLIPAVIWDLIWKGLALWKAARKKRYIWFIALLVLNTIGILPIIYLLFVPKQKKKQQKKKKK
ncbi:MAG: hypothetical protein KKC75_07280 [Nanoarchaeota archaeon]|nr:hypothetical protein [Nanoarchaeota archaeon]MBU1004565.1 hypothetical protein [Nanoarchaeota archaeon]MBU1946588.1 hypothetical protein [Nanoarchaeota archaeon]